MKPQQYELFIFPPREMDCVFTLILFSLIGSCYIWHGELISVLCGDPEGWDVGGGLLCGYHSVTAHWPDSPSFPSSSWDEGAGVRDSNTGDTNKYARSLKNLEHVRCSHNNRMAKKTQRRGPQTEEGQRAQPTTLLRTFVSTPHSNSHPSLHCQCPLSLPFCPWGSHRSRTCNPKSPASGCRGGIRAWVISFGRPFLPQAAPLPMPGTRIREGWASASSSVKWGWSRRPWVTVTMQINLFTSPTRQKASFPSPPFRHTGLPWPHLLDFRPAAAARADYWLQ